MKILKRLLRITRIALLVILAVYAGAALVLVNLSDPQFKSGTGPTATAEMSEMFKQVYVSQPDKFIMRDNAELFVQHFRADSNLTVIVLHGVLSSSYLMNRTSGMLQDVGSAEVFALDLRGHGRSTGRPGDVDYIDQYVDDLADVVAEVRKRKPGGKIVLAAHSMGGGIALRYALKKNAPAVDGYLLFSPHLGFTSPTVPKDVAPKSNTEEKTTEPFVKLHLTRTLGCIMLNAIGITHYNDRPTLFFNLPADFPLRQYSFRSTASMAPDDYRAALRAVQQPLFVIVGSKDEAFLADQFRPVVTKYSAGEVILVDGATHDGICYNGEAMAAAGNWLAKNGLAATRLSAR
jgi:alpha-beta hydrolase superfamily lysophospholipase